MSPRRKKVLTSRRREAVEVTQLFETMECPPSERWFFPHILQCSVIIIQMNDSSDRNFGVLLYWIIVSYTCVQPDHFYKVYLLRLYNIAFAV